MMYECIFIRMLQCPGPHCIKLISNMFAFISYCHGNTASQPIQIKDSTEDTINSKLIINVTCYATGPKCCNYACCHTTQYHSGCNGFTEYL